MKDELRPQTTIAAEETIRLQPIAAARMVGSERFVLLYQSVGAVAGLLAGILLTMLLSWILQRTGAGAVSQFVGDALIVLCVLVGWALGLNRSTLVHRARFLAGIRRRGAPKEVTATFEIDDACLRVITPRVDYRIAWDAILEVVGTATAWLIQVDTTTFVLPKRAFSDGSQEKEFMGQMFARMTPGARDRSDSLSQT